METTLTNIELSNFTDEALNTLEKDIQTIKEERRNRMVDEYAKKLKFLIEEMDKNDIRLYIESRTTRARVANSVRPRSESSNSITIYSSWD